MKMGDGQTEHAAHMKKFKRGKDEEEEVSVALKRGPTVCFRWNKKNGCLEHLKNKGRTVNLSQLVVSRTR